MIKKNDVLDKLKQVLDPELHINVVDLGLIYNVEVKKKDIFILMTLTFPGCPLGSVIHKDVKKQVGSIDGVGDIDLKITFDPPWTLSKISEEAKLELGMV